MDDGAVSAALPTASSKGGELEGTAAAAVALAGADVVSPLLEPCVEMLPRSDGGNSRVSGGSMRPRRPVLSDTVVADADVALGNSGEIDDGSCSPGGVWVLMVGGCIGDGPWLLLNTP